MISFDDSIQRLLKVGKITCDVAGRNAWELAVLNR